MTTNRVIDLDDIRDRAESDAQWLWELIRSQVPEAPPREPEPGPALGSWGRTGRAG